MTSLELTGPIRTPWHLGHTRVPAPGTRVHLMLQGNTRGLVGRGVVRSAPFRAGPADRPGTLGTHVLIEWASYCRSANGSPANAWPARSRQ